MTLVSYFPSLDLGHFLIVGRGPRSGQMIPWDSLGKLSAESSMSLTGVLSSLVEGGGVWAS